MNLNTYDMISNTVKLAQYKLSQHRIQGKNSKLNIFEVASLMDAIKTAEQMKNVQNQNIFHSMSLN